MSAVQLASAHTPTPADADGRPAAPLPDQHGYTTEAPGAGHNVTEALCLEKPPLCSSKGSSRPWNVGFSQASLLAEDNWVGGIFNQFTRKRDFNFRKKI